MKKNKKRIITISTLVGAVAVASTSLAILFYNVDTPTPIGTYITKFSSNTVNSRQKNELINQSIEKTRKILDKYEEDTGKKANLNLQLANLKQVQSAGDRNYWYQFDRTLKHIDSRLGLTNIQKTPLVMQQAYYNKDIEMMTFYWSADYNSIGTWTNYMFTDNYTLANLWPMVYRVLKTTEEEYSWERSLKTEMNKHSLKGNPDLPTISSHIELLDWLASDKNTNGATIDSFYTLVANIIGAWMSAQSTMPIQAHKKELILPGVKDPEDQAIYSPNSSEGVKFMDYLASCNPNIPFQEAGPGTEIPTLMSKGLYMPANPCGDISYRDYYIYKDEFKKPVVRDWDEADLISTNNTVFNPCFSKTSSSKVGQSVWIGLSSWTTVGDLTDKQFNDPANPVPTGGGQENYLVGDGCLNDLIHRDAPLSPSDPYPSFANLENDYNTKNQVSFTIRPIPWVDSQGNETGYYLSPADFLAGFKAFKRSVDCGINSNNAYFVDLLGLDFDKTFADPTNTQRCTSAQDKSKTFTVHFTNDKILQFKDVLDILQKQYYMALPAENEKVKNLIDDDRFYDIAEWNGDYLSTTSTDMSKFYGCGDGTNPNVWGNLWSCGPYYISGVDKQKISYSLNEAYFNSFDYDATKRPEYTSFQLQGKAPLGKEFSKIDDFQLKYYGSYNNDILFEQFKSGEVDKAKVEGSNLQKAVATMKSSLRYPPVQKVAKANVAGFNLQIYDKWNEPKDKVPAGKGRAQGIIMDQNNQPMWDPVTRKVLYTMDKYGNWDFSELEKQGRHPKLKSSVSDSYYRLIAKDFYTPKEDPTSISANIRFTMMNSINWVSLATLVSPGVTNSVQYSFIPYGCYPIHNAAGPDNPDLIQGEYWDYAANKRYMTPVGADGKLDTSKLDNMTPENIKLRLSGNCIWTYDELLSAMVNIGKEE